MYKKLHTTASAFAALQQGNEEGLEYFFNTYYTPLTFFANKLVTNEQTAEDLVADAFVKLWNKKESITQSNAVKSYLYTSVRNAAIDHLRKQKITAVHQAEVIYLHPVEDSTIVSRIIETETYHQLYQSLQTLPQKYAEIINLHIQGKTHKQIAQQLGIAEKTVRNQKSLAIQLLKKSFNIFSLLIILLGN